jgi:hypothetical protein
MDSSTKNLLFGFIIFFMLIFGGSIIGYLFYEKSEDKKAADAQAAADAKTIADEKSTISSQADAVTKANADAAAAKSASDAAIADADKTAMEAIHQMDVSPSEPTLDAIMAISISDIYNQYFVPHCSAGTGAPAFQLADAGNNASVTDCINSCASNPKCITYTIDLDQYDLTTTNGKQKSSDAKCLLFSNGIYSTEGTSLDNGAMVCNVPAAAVKKTT